MNTEAWTGFPPPWDLGTSGVGGDKGPQVRARRMGWLCSLCVRTRRPRLYRDLEDLDDGGILYTHQTSDLGA